MFISNALIIFGLNIRKRMQKKCFSIITLLFLCYSSVVLHAQGRKQAAVLPAAQLSYKYIKLLKGKRVAMVVNQTSTIDNTHLVDSLLHLGIDIKKIFCPEHGFRGNLDAGEDVNTSIDSATKLPLISIYGNHKKPNVKDLEGIDIMVFDIQDVGVRFYTYISTLHYVMEACAENNIPLLILDRPNPNGDYIDGPVMKKEHTSFVGMHPVPIVHGMTMAEYARMINGEGWLANSVQCKIHVVRNANYNHQKNYTLPIKPSPNLVDQEAIRLYPSVCLFEGTVISVGRGTYAPFKIIGHPSLENKYAFTFTPESIVGMSKEPPYKNQQCYGIDIPTYVNDSVFEIKELKLQWLIDFYQAFENKEKFFNSYFEKLVGTSELRKQIIEGKTEAQIKETWQEDLIKYKEMRRKYLLYR